MSVLKNKQSGSTTLINLSQAVTVSSYTMSHSILFFTFKGGDAQVDRSLIRGVKSNSTTITFYRANNTGTTPSIEWELLEFDADTDVQDINESGTGTQNTSITSVDLNNAYVVSSGVTNEDDTLTDTTTARLELTSATNVQRVTGTSGTSGTFAYQVVEQAGTHGVSSVQYYSLASQTGTSISQTISSVNTGRTVLYASAKANASYNYRSIFSLNLASATSVTGTRVGNTSFDVGFYVVQFDSNVVVQRGSTAVGTDTDVTISAVQVANAYVQMSGAHSCGFALGSYSDVSTNGDEANVMGVVETSTNLNLSRFGTTGTQTVNWQVVEADPSAVSNILLNDTPTVGTEWSSPLTFSHTLGGNTYRIMIVCVTTRGNSLADTAVSCTFNGSSMTQAVTSTSGSSFNVRSTIFYMLHSSLPAAGSYSIVVTCSTGSPQSIEAVAYSVRGAKQQAPEVTVSTGADASALIVATPITTLTANGLTVDCLVGDNIPSAVCRTGQTLVTDTVHGGSKLQASFRETGLAEEWKMAWTMAYALNRWAHTLASFEQAPQGQVESLAGSSAGTSAVSGSVLVDTMVAGTANGDTMVGGTLLVGTALVGVSNGVATVEGSLSSPVRLNAASNGTSLVGAMLAVDTQLAGQSNGSSAVSGIISVPVELSGSAAGSSSVASDLDVFKFLSALVTGVATVTADLSTHMVGRSDGTSFAIAALEVLRSLRSQVAGSSSLVGTLHHAGKFYGSSNGIASVTGALTVTRELIHLLGASHGTSTVVGDGALLHVLTELLGGIPGQATVTGTLTKERPYEGQSHGVSTVSGSLEVLRALVAASVGDTTVTGDLAVLLALAGASDGWADVQGSLYGAIKIMNVASHGQASVTGTLTVAARRLAGMVTGVATAQGSLLVQTSLVGLVSGLADVEATLRAIRHITGQANGVGSVAGTLAITRGVVATIAAAATVSGTVEIGTALRAAVAGVATVSAMLESQVPVAGASGGVAYVTGVLNVLRTLEAVSNGDASVGGWLHVLRPLAGSIEGDTTVTADMLNFVWHEGQSDGEGIASAALQVRTAFEAAASGQSAATGALWVATALIGESLGLSHPMATLNVEGLGLGPTLSRGRARVRGTLSVIRLTSSTSVKDDPRIITRTIP